MPLSERARIEFYLPDLPRVDYQDLLEALAKEFTYAFGGCTIIHGLDGSCLSQTEVPIQDRINLIYADTPYGLTENFQIAETYGQTQSPRIGSIGRGSHPGRPK